MYKRLLCLYVCPVGATDTENSIIDVEKCLGCGVLCQSLPQRCHFHGACRIPASAEEDRSGNRSSFALAEGKARQEKTALQLAETAETDGLYRLMTAFAKSVRLVNDDLLRESGYMLPQSANARQLLKELVKNPPSDDFPAEAAEEAAEADPVQ